MKLFPTDKIRRQAGDAHAVVLIAFVAVAATGGSVVVFNAHKNAEMNKQSQAVTETTTPTDTTKTETVTTTPSSKLSELAAAQKSCGYTVATSEGPYYISGTSMLSSGKLNYDKLDGTPVKIGGYVYGSEDNTAPVVNAKIEIWQTDDNGVYHPQANGTASKYTKDELSLRGYVKTNSKGYYEFTTILPGEPEGQPRHINVKASAAGYGEVISQIITSQDGDITSPGNDPTAQSLPLDCAWLKFKNVTADSNGLKADVYNIHLRKN